MSGKLYHEERGVSFPLALRDALALSSYLRAAVSVDCLFGGPGCFPGVQVVSGRFSLLTG